MNKLSQRTIVRMMEALSTVPGVECSRVCFEQDIPNWFVTHARSYYRFNWDHILPALRDTRFFFANYSSFGGNILGKEYFPEDEARETGEWLLQKLAAIAACLPDGAPVENSLELDGYAVDKRRLVLVPLEAPVSAQEEEGVFTALLRRSGLPDAATVEQHLKDAGELFVQGKDHPSLNEARNILQALIDGISVETDRNGEHAVAFPGGTANRIEYLMKVGFLTANEQAAFGSAWGALSTGSHPGVPPHEEARIGLILALEFGQLLMVKYANWCKNGHLKFSP